MSDRTQNIYYLSLHSCNNRISFTCPGALACELGLLWAWMLYEVFACLAYWWGKISWNYCIYQWKLSPQEFWNSVMVCHYHTLCKQFNDIHVWQICDQKTFLSKSDTCFYDQVCKELFLDPLYLHHPCHCCKAWWC